MDDQEESEPPRGPAIAAIPARPDTALAGRPRQAFHGPERRCSLIALDREDDRS
jgi:hypothetical protein